MYETDTFILVYLGVWLGVLAFCAGLFCLIFFSVRKKRRNETIREDIYKIKQNTTKVIKDMERAGVLNATKHFSVTGYSKYTEYRTDFNGPDNVHAIFDDKNKKIACYMLEPYVLMVYDYKDILKTELTINNGVMETSSTTVSSAGFGGNVAVGTSNSFGTIRQTVTSILGTVFFKDGESFSLGFNNNVGCYSDGAYYRTCVANAKAFCAKVEAVIQQEREHEKQIAETIAAKRPSSYADELLKLKQLLDAGLITQEEFDKKKNELL